MTSGTKPNTSLILTDAELEYIRTHFAGSKSAAIHKALENMMNTQHKAVAQDHGNKQWYVHTYNEYYKAMEELGPYTYWQARSLAKQINDENKAKAKAENK